MKTLRWIVAGLVLGLIGSALRNVMRGDTGATPPQRRAIEPNGPEPVLGYDGMDQETLLEWLPAAGLDFETLDEIIQYEEANLQREVVLELLEEMAG